MQLIFKYCYDVNLVPWFGIETCSFFCNVFKETFRILRIHVKFHIAVFMVTDLLMGIHLLQGQLKALNSLSYYQFIDDVPNVYLLVS